MNVAFIPVRGGSKSIPFKNIKTICGRPLVFWTIRAACECAHVDAVYVATDSDRVRETLVTLQNEDRDLLLTQRPQKVLCWNLPISMTLKILC